MRHGRIIRYYYKTDGIISNQNLGPSFLDVRITDITLTPVICKCIVMDQLQNCGTDIGAMFFFIYGCFIKFYQTSLGLHFVEKISYISACTFIVNENRITN